VLVETALRRRADEIGRWTPSSLPLGVTKWVPFLLQREWRIGMELRTVAAGRDRSFFVDANGTLLACGAETEGENGLLGLRDGPGHTPFTAAAPTAVPSLAGVRIRAVVCHDHCNLALSEAGQVFEWGCQLQASVELNIGWAKRQAPVPTLMEKLRYHRVRQVVAGHFHCAALTECGALFTWETCKVNDIAPDQPMPELGHGSSIHELGVPHRVLALAGEHVISVAVGIGFTVAVTAAGAGYSFGMGDGRLGHGVGDVDEDVFLFKRIGALDGMHVASVAASDGHTLALTRCGRVYWWGSELAISALGRRNERNGGAEDLESSNPHLITALLDERVKAIAAGPSVSCAVTYAGAFYTWGDDMGDSGDGDVHRGRCWPEVADRFHRVWLAGASNHANHGLALAASGRVYPFGEGFGLGLSRPESGSGVHAALGYPASIPGLVCMVPEI
jgi:alpha-tubulin suppressor-like RCC1 family protein